MIYMHVVMCSLCYTTTYHILYHMAIYVHTRQLNNTQYKLVCVMSHYICMYGYSALTC